MATKKKTAKPSRTRAETAAAYEDIRRDVKNRPPADPKAEAAAQQHA